ncbi:MAG: hypothetical protein ACTHNY_05735 [Solirubrobacterales bacterium]
MRSHPKAAFAASTHRESGRFSLGVIAAMLVCAAAFLGIGAPAASAAAEAQPTFSFLTTFDAEGIGDSPTPSGPLAVDGSGNIFLADELFEHVHVYAPDPTLGGTPLTTVAPSGGCCPSDVAIDPASGDLYIQEAGDFGSHNLKRYTSDGGTPPVYTVDPGFSVPPGKQIAVDPLSHDLLVADADAEAIRRYNTAGTLVATISTPGVHPTHLAVAADGSLFVPNGSNVLHLSGSGTQLGEIENVGQQVAALTVDPKTQNLVVNVKTGKLVVPGYYYLHLIQVYSPSGSLISTVQGGENMGFTGMAIDAVSGRLYADRNSPEGQILVDPISVFVPAVLPGVEPATASDFSTTGFHVEAEVDPGKEGLEAPDGSSVRFEYRLAGSNEDWAETAEQAVDAPGFYGADLSGLEPNRTYEVRAVASNALASNSSTPTTGTTIAAPPSVETGNATEISETSAVITGRVNPFGLQTTYYFEYGPTTAYGTQVPVGSEGTAGQGQGSKFFSRTIVGLSPGTTYHFRIVATNGKGVATGDDQTFTTIAAGASPARAYEQVTPADKHGIAIESKFGGQASLDGNAFTYVAASSTQSAPILPRLISLRGATDWKAGIGTDPPLAAANYVFLSHVTLAVSRDFTHAFVVSNRALAPGGVEQGGNLYRVDLASGAYEFIGGSTESDTFNSFAGATTNNVFQAGASDLSWIVFFSRNPLLPGAPHVAMYRWSESDGLEVVSVLPNGEMSSAVKNQAAQISHYVSADGRRIYFTAGPGASEEGVFLREGGETVSVSHALGDPTTPEPGNLLGTTTDGRYAFFVSAAKLTADAPGESGDLYRYDASTGDLQYLGARANVSITDGPDGRIAGFTVAIGADGETIYFNEETVNGIGAFTVWHKGEVHTIQPDRVRFEEDRPSSNGRYFALYATVDGTDRVVELYDAETKEVSCVSCRADGTPVSAELPVGGGGDITINNRYGLSVADDGTVYFSTRARLVAADVNGTRDVYTWRDGKPTLISPGTGPYDARYLDATPDGSNIFFATAQKLVGRDTDKAYDVYDARINGGLPAQSPPPAQECLRDDCKATPNAGPELPFGGSEALSGPENVKPVKHKKCGKNKRAKKVKGKVRCVRKHTKHKAGKNKKGGNR